MTALYKKELRNLLPLLLLVAFYFGSDFVYRPLADRLDEISWLEQSARLTPGGGKEFAVFLMFAALIAAYSLFPREHDEKTIEWLYALPITRRGIFLAKALAAWTVLGIGIVLDQLAGVLLQALNPQSFVGEQWSFDIALRVTLLDVFFSAAVLLHGMLISFLRRFGLIVYAMAALTVMLVKKFVPGQAYIDPLELLTFKYHGADLVVPWTGLFFHGVVALVAGALAYVLWMGTAERFVPVYARLESHPGGKVALGCVTVSLTVGGLVWFSVLAAQEVMESEPVKYQSFLPVRATTRWYDFTYAANLSARAHELIGEADPVYESVAVHLDVEPGPRIDADLTDEGSAHLGIAQGGVIRVALESLSKEMALHTLYHETVHAFQFMLAGRRAVEHHNSIRSFIEGSAEWVTRQLLDDPDARDAHRRLAAAAWERHDIRFEDLIDDEGFRTDYDPNLVYTLGATWTTALAEVCGDDVVGRFFRALDRDDAPEDLEDLALWQDTLRAADCALEPAVARWGEKMNALARSEQAFLDALPRLGGGFVRREDDMLVFTVRPDRAVEQPAETYYLRIRRDPSVPEDQIYTFTAELDPEDESASFHVDRGWLDGGSFEIQFGQSIDGSLWPFFEAWQAASTGP